jgi:cytochrome bd ubiquinol oxidase subunit II
MNTALVSLPTVIAAALLVSLTAYALTGGADYGGGVWDLLASGPRAARQQELIAHAIGPIWEADHVWLILAIVLMFTAFPSAFAAITTALNIPLSVMLVGIVLRGSAFSFRTYGQAGEFGQRHWGRVFAIASLVTPMLLGVSIGAIASGRLPAHPRELGDFIFPWLRPFPLAVGVFAIVLFAYLAAVYLTVEAGEDALREDFRKRALVAAVAVGIAAGAVLFLAANHAPIIWRGLTRRVWTWPLFWTAGVLAIGALLALWTRHYRIASLCAAWQVTLILWGWAFAQFPYLVVPSITIYGAAGPRETLGLLTGALVAGSAVLFPSLWYLLRTFKRRAVARQAVSRPQ